MLTINIQNPDQLKPIENRKTITAAESAFSNTVFMDFLRQNNAPVRLLNALNAMLYQRYDTRSAEDFITVNDFLRDFTITDVVCARNIGGRSVDDLLSIFEQHQLIQKFNW